MTAGFRMRDSGFRNGTRAIAQSTLRAIDELGVKRLVSDSREVKPGDVFVAYPGETRDGRDYIPQALANGAAAVLWERRDFAWNPAWRAANFGVTDLRRCAGEIASYVYGRPSARLWVVGVTGTNGKTSCSQWIAQSLTRTGRKCAVVGTLGSGFPGALEATANTTPDAVWLHATLDKFLRDGARAVSMEASSHGLVQHRLSGIEFDVALLTNISRDHLEYHGTMRRYRAAKARLFRWPSLKYAVLNLDDSFGAELVSQVKRPGVASLESRLIGRFNAANLLGSLATLLASEVSLEDSVRVLQRVKAAPGRTERYGGGRKPLVVVDYAHTPDALEKVLLALQEIIRNHESRVASHESRVICVFGCGGERDPGKRPLMGAIAARLAHHVIITSDNPRGEDPREIIADIAKGVRGGRTTIEPNRARAIRLAVGMACRGDAVLVAGKGHEQYQEIGGVKYPFSDAAVVTAALQETRS